MNIKFTLMEKVAFKTHATRGVLLIATIIMLPLLEWRVIEYQISGTYHLASPFAILFFFASSLSIINAPWKSTFLPTGQSEKYRLTIYIALIAFVISWAIFAPRVTAGAKAFTLVGAFAMFLATHSVFLEFKNNFWKRMPYIAATAAIVYMLALICLIYINSFSEKPFINVEDLKIVGISKDIFQIRPYQVASIVTYVALIGSVSAIQAKKQNLIFLIVPFMLCIIGEAGSRSGYVGFLVLWLIFTCYTAFIKFNPNDKFASLVIAIKMLCSLLLGLVLLEMLPNLMYNRAKLGFDLFNQPYDLPRAQLWELALSSKPASGVLAKIGQTDFGSFHNVFLDIYVGSGYPALISFVIFLAVIAFALIETLKNEKVNDTKLIEFCLTLCFIVVVFQGFINPMLSFSSAWIMLGLIVACI